MVARCGRRRGQGAETAQRSPGSARRVDASEELRREQRGRRRGATSRAWGGRLGRRGAATRSAGAARWVRAWAAREAAPWAFGERWRDAAVALGPRGAG